MDKVKARLDNRTVVERASLFWIFVFAVVAAIAWGSDFITLEGERTIYTVDCSAGAWAGTRCAGNLVAGQRYRFRALKAHREVLFWTVGVAGNSGKYSDCTIHDGRNWSCIPDPDAPRTITYEMHYGQPVPDQQHVCRAFHSVPKWQWVLLRYGIPITRSANE